VTIAPEDSSPDRSGARVGRAAITRNMLEPPATWLFTAPASATSR
jgi:hypothetical protein